MLNRDRKLLDKILYLQTLLPPSAHNLKIKHGVTERRQGSDRAISPSEIHRPKINRKLQAKEEEQYLRCAKINNNKCTHTDS